MAILRHVEATADERAAFSRCAAPWPAKRGEEAVETVEDAGAEELAPRTALNPGSCRRSAMSNLGAKEQVILTLSQNGYGKRTSAYEFRVTGRGGKGIVAMAVNDRNGPLVASFPVEESDQIMLVTDGGQLIRCPVAGIRVKGGARRASSCSTRPRTRRSSPSSASRTMASRTAWKAVPTTRPATTRPRAMRAEARRSVAIA